MADFYEQWPNIEGAPAMHWAHIQWKGTEVCLDLTCPHCGRRGHADAEFAYELMCSACGGLIQLSRSVAVRPVERGDESIIMTDNPPILDIDGHTEALVFFDCGHCGGTGTVGDDEECQPCRGMGERSAADLGMTMEELNPTKGQANVD